MYICTWHLNLSHTITARFLEQTHYQPWPICTCKIHSQQHPWIIIIAIYISRWKVLLFSQRTWELTYGDMCKSFYTWCLAVSIAFLTWHFHSIVQQGRMHALSSTWCEFDPNTAYVVCISICPYFLIWYPYAPTSLFGNTAHCSGCGVAMGCYRLCIVPRTAIVTSQWYDRYCFTEYARTWARHPTTPWQRQYTAITDCQSIDSL